MTLAELIVEFRSARSDDKVPYLWSDEEITAYLNEAMNEACERALLIEDRTTGECCTIGLSIAEPNYTLHESVLGIKRLTVAGLPLDETSIEDLDAGDAYWETRTGAPRAFVREGMSGLRIVPIPTAAEDATLTVWRLPLEPLSADRPDESPEIHAIYHRRLLPWVYRCALLKSDAETVDKAKALEQEAIFEQSFGVRPDANVQRKRRDRRPPVVAMVY